MTTILGHEYGILTGWNASGSLIGSAMFETSPTRPPAWRVSTLEPVSFTYFVETEAEAREVLAVLADMLDGAP